MGDMKSTMVRTLLDQLTNGQLEWNRMDDVFDKVRYDPVSVIKSRMSIQYIYQFRSALHFSLEVTVLISTVNDCIRCERLIDGYRCTRVR